MIVNRADTFGLAQLYQLRGRVGRSSQRAFAYFLIPGEGTISPDARERLRVIQELTELGAGFRIATHDLEIRGAGDFLGARQSGNIAAVGFELYSELLEEAVNRLKGESVSEKIEPEIALKVPAFVPEDYVQDPNQRLIIYKRLAQSTSEEDADLVGDEMTDRFGRHPLSVDYLLESMKLRIHLRRLMVKRLEFDGRSLLAAFHENTPVSPDTVIEMVRRSPEKYRFSPDFVLSAAVRDTTFEGILAEARNLLKSLG
jgi:transcription-repair coupling factor (superfamily II helicase)